MNKFIIGVNTKLKRGSNERVIIIMKSNDSQKHEQAPAKLIRERIFTL